jgi:hypothetical protein
MRGMSRRYMRLRRFVMSTVLLLSFGPARAQERNQAGSTPESSNEALPAARELAHSLRELQAQVQLLTTQVGELQKDQQRAVAEAAALRNELNATKSELASRVPEPQPPVSSAVGATPSLQATVPASQTQSAATPSVEERLLALEDNQQLTDSKLSELSQTRVESGSKYRVRLSGIVLVNLFHAQGTVDNLDFPQLAVPPEPLQASSAFGASLRQSQIGLEVFGPEIGGARTSANVKFDFAGGSVAIPNGVNMGVMRLRTAAIHFDWENTSVVAGQDSLFFAPLTPTSLASLAVPALSYAGNLWSWTPQVRVEHRIALTDDSSVLLQGGILDSLTGEVPEQGYRYPTAGEQSGQPAYASRVALRQRIFGRDLTAGMGGYYGRQNWGFGRQLDGWAGTADLTIPFKEWVSFSGEFYRGRGVGGLSGAIGQTILLSGSILDPTTTIRGLDSMGGWVQVKVKPRPNFEVNAAFGQDNPFAGELRRFPATAEAYGPSQSRNFSPFINFIYQLRSDVLFSVEYRRLQSYALDSTPSTANYFNISLGYLF